MKLGQTSIIHFLSRIGASVLGFVATLYLARLLGADGLGIYSLTVTLVTWLSLAGDVGVSTSIKKRVSEKIDQYLYTIAGSLLIFLFMLGLVGIVLVFRPIIDNYIGYPATGFVILLLVVNLSYSVISSIIEGIGQVHVSGLLSTVRISARSVFQIAALMIGLGIPGLFLGYAAGWAIVILIGAVMIGKNLTHQPIGSLNKSHIRSLLNYAKFAWLGGLRNRSFNSVDIAVLGVFVSSSLVGIYTASWNIAAFLILFSGSLSSTLFPEISRLSAEGKAKEVSRLVNAALSYAGLFLIPGLVGSLLLGERILRIYGEEFTTGATVLSVLIIACLIQSYQKQLVNTLNAIDRPEIAFRVNLVFIVANLMFNLGLIYLYGVLGAAVATGLAVFISLVLAYLSLRQILDFTVPYAEIARQWIAALLMGAVVYGGLWIESTYRLLGHNFATVLILVGIGAVVYFLALLAISGQFRRTVSDNLPVNVPLLA